MLFASSRLICPRRFRVAAETPKLNFQAQVRVRSVEAWRRLRALAWARAKPCQRFRKSRFQTVKSARSVP